MATHSARDGDLSDIPPTTHPEPAVATGVTGRAILLGLGLVIGLDLLTIYVRYIFLGSLMTYSHVPMAMLIVLTLMLAGGAVFSRITGVVLSPEEWHTIVVMGLVGATLPCFGLVGYLIGYLASPFYFATPENAWDAYMHPHIPGWLVPSGEGKAVAWFFEGLPAGAAIPWEVWLLPLAWWTTVIVAAFVVFVGISVILRKQWIQHERLVFPAMAPVIELVSRPGSGKHFLPEFARDPFFAVGFAISFGMLAWNCAGYFISGFPQFPIYSSRWYWIDRQFPPIRGYLGVFTVFFSYFASLDVLFSLWFFDLVFILEGGLLNKMGYQATSPYWARGVCHWQTTGAFVYLVLSVLWVARGHLRQVWKKTIRPGLPPDDSGEWISYRAAVLGVLGGLLYLWVWAVRIGFDPGLAAWLLICVVFVYVGLAKIIGDSGLPFTNLTINPWDLVAPFVGGQAIGAGTHVANRFASLITGNFKGLFMPALIHAQKVAEPIADRRRGLIVGVGAAFLVSLFLSLGMTLYLGYTEGAQHFDSWGIRAGPSHLQSMVNQIKKGATPPFYTENPEELAFFALGGAAMAALIYLRHRFVWWPLHPVGLAISGSTLARLSSFTIFVAWFLKLVLLKVAGPAAYRRSRPLFVGLLIGYVLGVALSTFVDMIWFPERGHYIHRY